jgi:hypothetical protein
VDHNAPDILCCACFFPFLERQLTPIIIGRVVSPVHANHRGATGSAGCSWYVQTTQVCVDCAKHKQYLAFVLAGIPMYYITRHGASMPLRSRFRGYHRVCCPVNEYLCCPFTAILSPLLSRLFSQSPETPGFGWQAVATDGDDGIEMTEGR